MILCPETSKTALLEVGWLRVAGKFLRQGGSKVFLRGISYGPFRPNSRGEPWPEAERLRLDLEHITSLGFDTVRLYHPPDDELLRTARRLGLKLIVGIAWTDHLDFLRDRGQRRRIIETVEAAATRLRDHPCVSAFLIGNEIEKNLVRWMGPRRVRRFLENLIARGKLCAPNQLFSYATYPSTEYLIPRNADFLAVNVYLEKPAEFASYLQRLQNLAGNKPLLITEFGMDASTHGEQIQAESRQWFDEACRRAAVSGTVWFSYTDEWFRGGEEVTGWQFGMVDAARSGRLSARTAAPVAAVPECCPHISVIVCTYNGTATLRACLESLQTLSYPNYEVLLVDDGSTRDIASIAQDYPGVRYLRQNHAGLSVARNFGAGQAAGEILVYTDDDCLVEEDWLKYLISGFDDPRWVACGGPNIPPPPRNATEAVVAAAPGAPAHVLLNDIEAEHLPGCNLAIRKTALEAIGGFRPVYRVAGDDVDICWRLREAGGHLRFVPGAMVWHHRRYTLRGYLRQQSGYGHAEALLMKEHPQHFGPLGGARWRGVIYGDLPHSRDLAEGAIFHGPFGNGLFQGIYQHSHRCPLDWFGGVLCGALFIAALVLRWPIFALAVLTLSVAAGWCRMRHLTAPPHALGIAGNAQLLALCCLQPILREWSRLKGMFQLGALPSWHPTLSEVFVPAKPAKWSLPLGEWAFWNEDCLGRDRFLENLGIVINAGGMEVQEDDGWSRMDLEAPPNVWFSSAILTLTEYHGQGRCLTRVRGMLRMRPLLAFLLGLFTLVTALSLFWIPGTIGFISCVLDCLWLPSLILLFRFQLRGWVFKAAARSGLTPCKVRK
jgi:GT2 family glycosyltransferase